MRKLYLILLLPVFWLTSCNSFLDVSADNELLQKEIFGDYKGVRMAVNGVYRNLSSTSLYGQNLTWGFASAIGHNYQSGSSTICLTGCMKRLPLIGKVPMLKVLQRIFGRRGTT